MAPEVQRQEAYGTAVDIWSAGVVLCKMLTREMPFDSYDDLQVVRNLDFSLPHWKHVPDEARHLVSRMLEYDPQKRITAPQILGKFS
jgi:serine/threonine protein kinase